MSFYGFCNSCEYEGDFDDENICPECGSDDIIIYEENDDSYGNDYTEDPDFE